MNTVLNIMGVSKLYRQGDETVRALDNVSLSVHSGEMVALTGPSGSGKTTLLSCAGLMIRPTQGIIKIAGDSAPSKERDRALWRNERIGFIYQSYAIEDDASAIENARLPLAYARKPMRKKEQISRAEEVLATLGLSESMTRRPAATLSGGQRQRVAIARALVNHPLLILADEPTAALDSNSIEQIMKLFRAIASSGTSLLIATHDDRVVRHCNRSLHLIDGRLGLI